MNVGRLRALVRRYRVLIWFVVGLAVLDRAVATQARRWEAFDPHPQRERMALCREGRWDALVVGGSPAMCGFDPDVLAGTPWRGGALETWFNYGVPLGTSGEAWLAAEHATRTPPKLVIYGASCTDFNADRLSSTGPREMMTFSDLGRAAAAQPKLAGWFAWNFGNEWLARGWQLYYHRRGIRLCLADAADRAWPGVCPNEATEARRGVAATTALRTNHGYAAAEATDANRLDRQKAAGQKFDRFGFMENYRLGAVHLASLDFLMAAAARKNIPLVIVDMPVPADLDVRLYPKQYAEYRAALASAAAARGVPVLRASREAVGLTDADFADLVHLNRDGGMKLCNWLRAVIAAGGATP